MLETRIEKAAMNAWPAAEQMLLDGWILRFTNGYTKRANSVNPFRESLLDTGEKIERCERIYAERGLPAIFRLTSFLPSNRSLDGLLAERGYGIVDPTLVLSLGLEDGAGSVRTDPGPAFLELDAWLDAFYAVSGLPGGQRRNHGVILTGIREERFLAVVEEGGEAAACGMGVLGNELFGVFDMVTAREKRGRGLATRLLSGLLQRAREGGASLAYLQVMHANAPARRLYEKFGFRKIYDYRYRVPGR